MHHLMLRLHAARYTPILGCRAVCRVTSVPTEPIRMHAAITQKAEGERLFNA